MRDIIWTIIGIWVLWRIIEAFRSFSSTKRSQNSANSYQTNGHNTAGDSQKHASSKKGELKPGAGEYVDYEEIK